MKLPRLTPRLQKIYDIISPCGVACDIGTDHAYIPVCLTLSGKCKSAVASDIKAGPVNRARETVRAYGAEELVSVRLGGGLETVSRGEADAIIIAGMGGLLIARILQASEDVAKSAKELVLQPMTATAELREYLNRSGYIISREYIVREDEKLYTVISAKAGVDSPYTAAELYMGREVEKGENYEAYRNERLFKLKKQIKGLSCSQKEENIKRLSELKELKEMIENENL